MRSSLYSRILYGNGAMKLNIVSIDCVCGAMLYPPSDISDVGEQNYVEELVNPDNATVQSRVSELSARAAKVQTQTTTRSVTINTPKGPIQVTIPITRIIAQRRVANLGPDSLSCPVCGRKVITIIWPQPK